ncbi:MAG: sigma-54-dependent Fis family transcriptional regulator [Acidobacteria bacterium]|nr:MAG: sigma-54-dependent Fis family transcriptional regulator [Acidobacteriota bacterium]
MPEARKHLLLVEDEAPLRQALAERLGEHGFDVEQADTGEQALEQLAEFAFDIVITDLRLPGIDGTRVLESALARYPDIVGIIVTGYGTVKDAVEAIKRGATDFVTKPFQFDELLHALNSALEQRRLKAENAYLRSQLQERYRFEGLIGRSPAMRELFALLETVSAAASTILVTGETGTGKEVVARAIHHNSPRRAQRFIALNCGAIPETLLEAELFGHVRGAFTGAIGTRQGRLEQANKGTLFLDEIGTMSPGMQMKLLRVLQEREFERIGDTHTTKVDVRVVAATNSDLQRMVAEATFREDLFYRLNIIPIHLPPLRDRKEDIPLLVQHFLKKFSGQESGAAGSRSEPPRGQESVARNISISQQALRCLMAYPWPGNVRQLENAIERAVALSGGRTQIETSDLTPDIQQASQTAAAPDVNLPEGGIDFDRYINRIEHDLIRRALEKTGGNKGQASRLLNLKRTTLVEKLKRLEPRAGS